MGADISKITVQRSPERQVVGDPHFSQYIGIDYFGAKTSISRLRVYVGEGTGSPVEKFPPSSGRKYWSRKGVAEWIVKSLSDGVPTLVGIDHGFSFPLRYFEKYGLKFDWPVFLDDFEHYWPTATDAIWVRDVLRGHCGDASKRRGEKSWFRITEPKTRSAKSVFNFDQKEGCVAFSTHAGLTWLRFIRTQLGSRVHFWPFGGWEVPVGRSAIVEVYPALWNRNFVREDRSGDQHDAFCISAWLSSADRDGKLISQLKPALTPSQRAVAEVEGWILGAPADDGRQK
jgi:hypothetical protein